ncbi:MAG: hypothetical protein EA408_04075 [Marinilabiliales bacterium]|nr:MAG: hypothetical protein EA408_04075 [Marinilabiliales bacterium]
MDFLNWYKNIFESAGEEPPGEVWEAIQDELDIDTVWSSVENELSSRGRTRYIYAMAAAASLVALIGIGAFLFFLSNDPAAVRGRLHTWHTAPEYSTGDPAIRVPFMTPLPFPAARQVIHPETMVVTATQELRPDREEVRLFPAGPLPGYIPRSETDFLLAEVNVFPSGEMYAVTEPGIEAIRFWGGFSGHLANTWLLNNKTVMGLRPDEFTASLPSFGYNLGIVTGVEITGRFALQAEFSFISLARQDYNEYLYGKYITNSMQFDYSRLSLSGKWTFAGNGTNGKHWIILGGYSGLLRDARQDLGGELLSLKEDYNNIDYGILTGYEYEHPVSGRLSATLGINSKIGIRNIFAGNEIVPYYLNSTRNMSVNLTMSLRYNSR